MCFMMPPSGAPDAGPPLGLFGPSPSCERRQGNRRNPLRGQARPVDDLDLGDIHRVARDWLSAVFNTFSAEISDRETYLIGASPVLVSIGALGNKILHAPSFDRQQVLEEQLASIKRVDWRKSERWSGIAGRMTPPLLRQRHQGGRLLDLRRAGRSRQSELRPPAALVSTQRPESPNMDFAGSTQP
jgi:hypothetical protein